MRFHGNVAADIIWNEVLRLQVVHMDYKMNFHPCGQCYLVRSSIDFLEDFKRSFIFLDESLVFLASKSNLFILEFDEYLISSSQLEGTTLFIRLLFHMFRSFLERSLGYVCCLLPFFREVLGLQVLHYIRLVNNVG